jgi:hypothetical protein
MICAKCLERVDKVTRLLPRSAWRPGELAAPQHVEVQMPHGLAGMIAVVHDQPEVVAHTALTGDATDGLQEPSTKGLVVEVREVRDMPARHDQDVERGAREDVVDGHDVIVLVDDRRGDLPRHDATEQAVVHAAK